MAVLVLDANRTYVNLILDLSISQGIPN